MATELIARIFEETETIATVGLSTQPYKPSHYVPRYMMEHGYRVIPVHPTADSILGEKAYPLLSQVPGQVDTVQIFRPSAEVGPHVGMAIDLGARFVWTQVGIVDREAAARAQAAGLEVVMNRCMQVEHRRWRWETGKYDSRG